MNTTEISRLLSELLDLSKAYLEQEALAPLRRTARFAGISLLSGLFLAVGWVLLWVAGLRLIQDLLPDTPLWSVLAYGLAALLAVGLAALIVRGAKRSTVSP